MRLRRRGHTWRLQDPLGRVYDTTEDPALAEEWALRMEGQARAREKIAVTALMEYDRKGRPVKRLWPFDKKEG